MQPPATVDDAQDQLNAEWLSCEPLRSLDTKVARGVHRALVTGAFHRHEQPTCPPISSP